MTRHLRVKVGAIRYLLPAGMVGSVGGLEAVAGAHRRIDARPVVGRTGSGGGRAGAVSLATAGARSWAVVLVDEVESFVDIDDGEIVGLPAALSRLRALFDGLWFEAGRGDFQLRVDAAARLSFGRRRELLRAIAAMAPGTAARCDR